MDPTQSATQVRHHANPRCYARALGDCSAKISGEHYISKEVIALWAEDDIVATNVRGSEAGEMSLRSLDSLASNILCDRHNSTLSPVDDTGLMFCRFVKNVPPIPPTSEINGQQLERWFLKVLLGYSAVFHKQQQAKDREPSLPLLRALFSGGPLDDGCGFFGVMLDRVRVPLLGLAFRTWYTQEREVVAIIMRIDWLPVLFCAAPPPPTADSRFHIFLHPSSIVVSEASVTREIRSGWSKGAVLTYTK